MRKVLLLLVLAASSLVLIVGPSAAASDTPCMGTLPPGTYDNIVVPPGQTCLLTGVTVLGNVKALEDSRLHIQSSNVRGNVIGDKADTVELSGGTVRENIIIKEGGPAPILAPSGFFMCGFFPFRTPCEAVVSGTTVEEGSIQIEKMQGSVFVGSAGVLSPIRGNIKVEDNLVNAPDGSLGVISNRVAQNLQVFKNRGTASKFVTNNTVGESLQCFENDPPFTGTPNVAREAQGQCGATPLP
jgi:hypothetical protein